MANLLETQLINGCQQLGVATSPAQATQLLGYLQMLHKWNQAYNLTAIRDINTMLSRHILESLAVLPFLHGHYHIDIGTGAGLPGLPLAIMKPEDHWVLLDSNGKKTRFLTQVKHELQLANITIANERIEEFHSPKPFDCIVSRAFAKLSKLIAVSQHFADHNTRYLSLKSDRGKHEAEMLPPHFQTEHKALNIPYQSTKAYLLISQKLTMNG